MVEIVDGLPVAVDAMGGDRAPTEVVTGARQAAEEFGIPVLLVGDANYLSTLAPQAGVEILATSEVIGMDEDPGRAVRVKRDSSIVRCAEAVREGRACAMVSAGNTGAAMASALLRMGRLPGVSRPAIATPIPVPGSTPTVLIDSGANVDCTAPMLVQFAQMGWALATERFGIRDPRVGILSIGEEATKGNALVKEAHALLEGGAAGPEVRFIGNVGGGLSALTGDAAVKEAAKAVLPALSPLAHDLDPDTYGGAVLLGVEGVCVISHGSSGARAIVNAVKVAHHAAADKLVGRIEAVIASGRA
jgi:glycerol-3-phosphate acyltransferase PlsX